VEVDEADGETHGEADGETEEMKVESSFRVRVLSCNFCFFLGILLDVLGSSIISVAKQHSASLGRNPSAYPLSNPLSVAIGFCSGSGEVDEDGRLEVEVDEADGETHGETEEMKIESGFRQVRVLSRNFCFFLGIMSVDVSVLFMFCCYIYIQKKCSSQRTQES
jgi:hypothetical protein